MPFQIQCTNCQKTLNVPDAADGKRVRCPGCQTILPVTRPTKDDVDQTGVKAGPSSESPPASSAGAAESKKKAAWDTDEQEEEEPPKKQQSKKDSFDFDDDDDRRRRRKRKDYDDDTPDIRRDRNDAGGVNSQASAAMIMGIIGVALAAIGVLCCPIVLEPIALILGILAIVFGMMNPGNTQAKAGIICGIAALALVVLSIVVFVLMILFQVNMQRGGFG